jgi:general secretion pathway protein E
MNQLSESLMTSKQIGELLVERGLAQPSDIEKALHMQATSGGRIGSALVRIGALSEENLLVTLSDQLGVPIARPEDFLDVQQVHLFLQSSPINFDWFLSHEVIIWATSAQSLSCVARDILDPSIREVLTTFYPDYEVSYSLVSTYAFEDFARLLTQESQVESLFQGGGSEQQLRELAEEAPVVELVNNMLSQAVDAGASDVHIEPEELSFKVRFRIDGVLRDQLSQPAERFPAVASRIKLVSGLDIAERRLPQDGRITSRIAGFEMDLRVSTLPCAFGESIVMRLLPKNQESLTLDKLGLAADHLELMRAWAGSAGGIVLVTGPTGSGKSTTLHGALAATNDGIRKIITVEDPVEIQVQGITQIQVHADIGYTFARALRAILRQDPDVIMIGEIRDLETAEIAIQSALSGHLVLSTLHTGDALSSFTRLVDMGVEPFLVAAPLKGVQAQRLVRQVCQQCAIPYQPGEDIRAEISSVPKELLGDQWLEAQGCASCNGTGYKGRLGIYQMIPMDEGLKDLVVSGATLGDMRAYADQKGYRNLYQDGLMKASHGRTTVEELLRVVTAEEGL